MTSEVVGQKVNSWEDLESDHRVPGRWMFSLRSESDPVQGIGGILYVCPCGCGRVGGLDFHPRNPKYANQPGGRAAWNWDGNEERPTLTPSIQHIPHDVGPHATEQGKREAKCNWHGYLTDGVFRTC
jgi:Family of unknown function (DUF6527)